MHECKVTWWASHWCRNLRACRLTLTVQLPGQIWSYQLTPVGQAEAVQSDPVLFVLTEVTIWQFGFAWLQRSFFFFFFWCTGTLIWKKKFFRYVCFSSTLCFNKFASGSERVGKCRVYSVVLDCSTSARYFVETWLNSEKKTKLDGLGHTFFTCFHLVYVSS